MQRQGPGSDATTRNLAQKVMSLCPLERILDMGCGKGASALVLARETQAQVLALDNHQPFVDALQEAAVAEGLDQITAIIGSMDELDKITGTFDLIWSEGSAYIIGYEQALKLWRPLLTETGYLFISDLVQLSDELAPEARTYLEQEGVKFENMDDRVQQAKALGYQLIESFILPQQDWLDFYADMEQQIKRLEPEVGKDHPALISLSQEIDIYRHFGHQFGYACLLMQKAGGSDGVEQ
ncbi:SAM-dependent methyltransferase [Marinospirillum sp.]|uniref:SAM-dependent methyltransferase n=1 Tax=Marinospirillum sp. TaxID=2183934 RepID=UPI00384F6E63